jgi:three-Cys-motif partner protein
MSRKTGRLDEIGYWSEVKLDIIRKYASAYSTIMAKQTWIKRHIYIDAFAGAGQHISKTTGDFVPGSPLNALHVTPPFPELHLIDLDGEKVGELQKLTAGDKRVTIHQGDCNEVLLRKVFPRCQYGDYHRALCLLDPYKVNVNWEVLRTAGQMESVEIFYNFMIMDANMNMFRRDPSKVEPAQAARMNAAWGDDSWRSAAYQTSPGLFGDLEEKASNEAVSAALRDRLKTVAGFEYVPEPVPMRNSKGSTVYYLFFASPNKTGADIVKQIFDKYRNQGAQ